MGGFVRCGGGTHKNRDLIASFYGPRPQAVVYHAPPTRYGLVVRWLVCVPDFGLDVGFWFGGWAWAFRWKKRKTPRTALLSQDPAVQVSSALACFTAVFGMGTGGTTPLWARGESDVVRLIPGGSVWWRDVIGMWDVGSGM